MTKLEKIQMQIDRIKSQYDKPSQWTKDKKFRQLVQEREELREKLK